MFRRISLLIAVFALVVAACTGEEPLEGIDLPPAAMPDGGACVRARPGCDPIPDEPIRTDPDTGQIARRGAAGGSESALRVGLGGHFLGRVTARGDDERDKDGRQSDAMKLRGKG